MITGLSVTSSGVWHPAKVPGGSPIRSRCVVGLLGTPQLAGLLSLPVLLTRCPLVILCLAGRSSWFARLNRGVGRATESRVLRNPGLLPEPFRWRIPLSATSDLDATYRKQHCHLGPGRSICPSAESSQPAPALSAVCPLRLKKSENSRRSPSIPQYAQSHPRYPDAPRRPAQNP